MPFPSETGTGFQAADDEKKRNRRKTTPKKAVTGLLEAIKFVAFASDPDSKQLWPQYARIVNGTISAGDGIMSAGHTIEEDLQLCPHIGRLIDALSKAGGSLSMSALDNGRLSISGGNGLKAVVPCLAGEELPPLMPDMNIAPINDKIKEGFACVLRLAREDAETLVESSLLLRANTVIGTNRTLMLEFWHGNDLPPNLAVPQPFAKAVSKITKPLVGFGYSEGRSITFWFEGGCWIRTKLMTGEWPDVDKILNAPTSNLIPVPEKLFEALEAVTSFSKDGAVHFSEGKLKSTYANATEVDGGPVYGASYEVPGLEAGSSVTARVMKLAKDAAKTMDYQTYDDRILFYNDDAWLRGVLMKRIA